VAVTPERSQRGENAVLILAFVWVILFTYDGDVVDAIVDVTDAAGGPRFPEWLSPWVALAMDVVLILASAPLKRRVAKSDGDSDRLWGWWTSGALLTVGVHLMMTFTEPSYDAVPRGAHFWLHLLAQVLFVVGMGILLTTALNANPMTLFSRKLRDEQPRDWARTHSTLPLIVGSFFAWIATAVWYPVITPHSAAIGSSADQGCPPVVDPQYFSTMGQVIPALLITLGIESNYVRQIEATLPVRDPVQRAAPILTVILLCIAEGLALSALVKKDACGIGAAWLEYLALSVTVQAMAIALATLVWMLLVGAANPPAGSDHRGRRPSPAQRD